MNLKLMNQDEFGKPNSKMLKDRTGNEYHARTVGQGHNKPSQSPGQWKNYVGTQPNQRSPKNRQYHNSNSEIWIQNQDHTPRQQRYTRGTTLQQNSTNNIKIEDQRRRKEDMMKRVEEIEKRVIPILKSHRNNGDIDNNFGWNNKIEQRILKLQTNIDMIEKQMQIKLQKRILEVEKEWQKRFDELLSNPNWQIQRVVNPDRSERQIESPRIKNQRYADTHNHNQNHNHNNINKNNNNNNHNNNHNHNHNHNHHHNEQQIEQNEGYFTRRESNQEQQTKDSISKKNRN